MKFNNETVFCITITGADGKQYAWNVLAANETQLQRMIESAGVPATIDGELGIIAAGISEASASEIAEILNASQESREHTTN